MTKTLDALERKCIVWLLTSLLDRFGDTVSTAARMESTGSRNKIQVSQKTADLLIAAVRAIGSRHVTTQWWQKERVRLRNPRLYVCHMSSAFSFTPSPFSYTAGVLNTFWLVAKADKGTSVGSGSSDPSGSNSLEDIPSSADETSQNMWETNEAQDRDAVIKQERNVDWVVEILKQYIQQILAKRKATTGRCKGATSGDFELDKCEGYMLDEVAEVIALPQFDEKAAERARKYADIQIEDIVMEQLRKYVSIIASCYRTENPFHNFQHACQVVMVSGFKMTKIDLRPPQLSTRTHGLSCSSISSRP